MKKCIKCGRVLPLDNFGRDKTLKSGLRSRCKECTGIYYKQRTSEYTRKADQQYKLAHPYSSWAVHTISSHKVRGFEVLIKTPDLAVHARAAYYCAICGCALDWTPLKGRPQDNSPSLDRINNLAVMTLENTQIVCRFCNTKKSKQTMDELVVWCKKVIEYRSR
ncbi:hypothetical protein LCGC14_1928720 [marine sediment metagenome]|uniref:HNH endonuclease 5 domain-containing protein n=1 Tax=marine sediment metagenome TaxID=412755 RepID=A0A0F9FNM5_9ZZZZ